MPRYLLTVEARATIHEYWEYQTDDASLTAEQLQAQFTEGEIDLQPCSYRSQEVVGDEADRIVINVELQASATAPAIAAPTCDMEKDCLEPITYIDRSGFVYCTEHGLERRQTEPCRKLRPHEARKVLRGETLERY